MALTFQQVSDLVGMVVTVQADDIDCDICHGRVAEYAQLLLVGGTWNEGDDGVSLDAIKRHIEQCPCCRDEYLALLEGLKELKIPYA